jgi:peptidoglycan/xylan/chitin deacetylase (PgdA/CDA1 family)
VTLEEPIRVFLSHDVDWGKAGAPIPHILARRNRFDEAVLENLEEENPYQNIDEILEIEEGYGLRSTFFFRTRMDSKHSPSAYDIQEYRSDIRGMIAGGWEVGLHSDPMSSGNLDRLREEKSTLEEVAGTRVSGNRTHYTIDEANHGQLLDNLAALGFGYDSSIKYNRDILTERDLGYFVRKRMPVFPIGLMDALMFRGLVEEEQVLKKVKEAVCLCRGLPSKRALTMIWHNCSLKMKFGRRYSEVVEYLASEETLEIVTGIELSKSMERIV